jgi:hypothetical protein
MVHPHCEARHWNLPLEVLNQILEVLNQILEVLNQILERVRAVAGPHLGLDREYPSLLLLLSWFVAHVEPVHCPAAHPSAVLFRWSR